MPTLHRFYPAQLAAQDTAGGILALPNPEGQDLYVTRVVLDLTKAATAACTADVGIANNGTTSSDNLMDGIDLNAAVAIFDNQRHAGTNGRAGQRWNADQFLTVSRATGAAAGLEGALYVEYLRI